MVNIMNLIIASAPKLTNLIGKLIYAMYRGIGNFGWTVVVFTVALKVLLFPFDFWQKHVMRKNNKAMKIIAPEIEKLKKTYANQPDVLQQKQMELYKKHGYSIAGGCLPTIITLVIFFVVFSGFNACVRYENEMTVFRLTEQYNQTITANPTINPDELDNKMVAAYDKEKQSWLWVKNVFMSDTYANPVPTRRTFVGSGLGKIGGKIPAETQDVDLRRSNYDNGYDAVLKPAMEHYNKSKFFDLKNWNGYFILPALSIALTVISVKIGKASQPEMPATGTDENGNPVNKSQGIMKAMNWVMPIMIGVFSLFYSAAFCIYMFVNSFITVSFNLIYNIITKKMDAKEDAALNYTFRR